MPQSNLIVAAVDDDRRVRESVQSVLESAGYEAVAFESAETFLLSGALTMSRLEQAAEMPVSLVRSRTRQDYRREVVRGFMLRGLFNAARRAGADPSVLTAEMEAVCA